MPKYTLYVSLCASWRSWGRYSRAIRKPITANAAQAPVNKIAARSVELTLG